MLAEGDDPLLTPVIDLVCPNGWPGLAVKALAGLLQQLAQPGQALFQVVIGQS